MLPEIDAEGGKVRLVARRHGIAESLLYNWRSVRKAAAMAIGASENVEFIPAGTIEAKPPSNPAPRQQPVGAKSKAGSIEIVLASGTRVTVDAFVNEEALSRVLRAMQRLT